MPPGFAARHAMKVLFATFTIAAVTAAARSRRSYHTQHMSFEGGFLPDAHTCLRSVSPFQRAPPVEWRLEEPRC